MTTKTKTTPLKQKIAAMEEESENIIKVGAGEALEGFSHASTTRIFWKSRKRSSSASGRNSDKVTDDTADKSPIVQQVICDQENMGPDPAAISVLSERRKALFEPLEPVNSFNIQQPSAESLLPPPDFDAASYPKGWLIGKKRKLVNVDVVESMRRIAVQEMNRKDREINVLNEQLEEDSRCLEHLQLKLLEERSKRAAVERENAVLQDQLNMLMDMMQEDNETMGDENTDQP